MEQMNQYYGKYGANYISSTLSELFTISRSFYNSEQQYGQANTKHILSCYELSIKCRSIKC